MRDIINASIDENHYFKCSTYTIARNGEGLTPCLSVSIPDGLREFWAYIDFKKQNGEKFKTPRIDVKEGKITYNIPSSVLDVEGELEVQLIFHNKDGEIWKSYVKEFAVRYSINAENDIPDREDFVTEVQKLVDEAVETAKSVEERANKGEFNGTNGKDGKDGKDAITDQAYNPESPNAQSGKAVAEALGKVNNAIKEQTAFSTQINLKDLNVSPIEYELKITCKRNGTNNFSGVEVFACSQLTWNENEVVSGGLSASGGIYPDDRLVSTGFIKVEPNKVCRVLWGKTIRWVNLYDTNEQFIKQCTTADLKNSNYIFQIPANVMYMRVTIENGDTCTIKQGDIYTPNADGIIESILSTQYAEIISLTTGVYIQVEYNAIVNERLETAIAGNSEQIANTLNLLNAIQTMSIDVDRPTGNTITVEPETIYFCDSGDSGNLISFTQDSDNNKYTGRIVLMVVGKEYAHQNQYTLAYVVRVEKGFITPEYSAWSFYARRKDGYNTKITIPDGSSIVKIKNVKK